MNIMSFMCSIIVRCHALVLAYLLVNILAPFIHCVWQKRLVYERRFFMLWIFFSIACAMLHVQLSNSYAAVNGTLCCLPLGHAGVIEALCRREVYVLDLNDCAVEESSLTSTHPFHTVSWTALCKCQISVCALWEAPIHIWQSMKLNYIHSYSVFYCLFYWTCAFITITSVSWPYTL